MRSPICALLSEEEPAPAHEIPQGESVIEARDLAIGWPGGPILATGISFTLRPGSSLAIVGASGIGKTTLLATLTGVIPPKSGQALINGVPAWGAERHQVAAHITMTAEDAHVFATTIFENLRVARASLTRDEATDSTSRFCRSASARVFAAIPRPWGTLAAYCARLVALTLAAFACASLIGVCGNMAGGFYTTWSSVGQTIVDSLH